MAGGCLAVVVMALIVSVASQWRDAQSERASSIECVSQLKQFLLVGKALGQEGDRFPDLDEIARAHPELVASFSCPADATQPYRVFPTPSDVAPGGVAETYLSTHPTLVVCDCPVHGHQAWAHGSVTMAAAE